MSRHWPLHALRISTPALELRIPDEWVLNFAVLRDGRVVGTQGVETTDFAVRRSFDTGSWVGRANQGQGIGLEMRRAVLTFAFDHLGAAVANTSAMEDNAASLAITRRIGYEPNGSFISSPRGTPVRELRYVMTRERFEECGARLPISVEGLDACRALLGV